MRPAVAVVVSAGAVALVGIATVHAVSVPAAGSSPVVRVIPGGPAAAHVVPHVRSSSGAVKVPHHVPHPRLRVWRRPYLLRRMWRGSNRNNN